eukprot:TRINITY_DN772_c0_g1_i1.p1 TRINITY_DN772_c0_g1~~TRINITY_DN772_c0_g1_i1.p1  ORF type:complete len:109 (-),score=26.09 TRINITY_DN772_c0_g1_i1:105-431(-)
MSEDQQNNNSEEQNLSKLRPREAALLEDFRTVLTKPHPEGDYWERLEKRTERTYQGLIRMSEIRNLQEKLSECYYTHATDANRMCKDLVKAYLTKMEGYQTENNGKQF